MANAGRANMKPGTAQGGTSAKEFRGTKGGMGSVRGATKASPAGAASHPRLKAERAKQDRNDKGKGEKA